MSSMYFKVKIDFHKNKELLPDNSLELAVRKRSAPEGYKITEKVVKAIVDKEYDFHGKKCHAKFLFTVEKICEKKFDKYDKTVQVTIEADDEVASRSDSKKQMPAKTQQQVASI